MPTHYSSRRVSTAGVRRGAASSYDNSAWLPNRNIVRNSRKIKLGPVWSVVLAVVVTSLMGLFFVSQSSAVTSYDHQIAEVNSEIINLEAERDALAVENAKIHASAANMDKNEVAANMVNAQSSDFVAY